MSVREAGHWKHPHWRRLPRCLMTGKVSYPNVPAAEQVAANREAKGARPLRVYRCPWCGCPHLTSKGGA